MDTFVVFAGLTTFTEEYIVVPIEEDAIYFEVLVMIGGSGGELLTSLN